MLHEFQILYMEANNDDIGMVVEGLEIIIERDLNKHRGIVKQTKEEIRAFREARSHLVRRKQHFKGLMNSPKYNAESMKIARDNINIDIRHFTDKLNAAQEKLEFNQNIVDVLAKQLAEHNEALKTLAEHRKKELDGLNNRLGK